MLGNATFAQTDSAVQLHLLLKPADSVTVIVKKKLQPDSVLAYAKTFLGDRYQRGGTSTKGFDCSGYTMMVYRKFGIKLPHTSAGQSFIGVEIPKKLISKGDLLFFRGRNSRRRGIGHVGIVISEKGEPIQFIHSSTSSGVRVDRLDAEYYKKRYMKATRVLPLN
jgi:murein DD-endopeptidase / murein LD-carboxypeptidase